MRIVFFGSDDFAAVSLNELVSAGFDVVACVTGPDMRQGRGMKLALPVIKALALEYDIPCLQPVSLKDENITAQLKTFQADIFVVVAYGRILPQAVLDIPRIFCVNVHGSLLPRYRGAAPVNWAIINGDKETGVTVQKMNFELDAGDILAQQTILIDEHTDAVGLRAEMAQAGGRLLIQTLKNIEQKKYECLPQDASQVSYASKLTKELGSIRWQRPAVEIERLVRGLKPWPGTYTHFKGKVLKILDASVVTSSGQAGSILSIGKEGVVIACGTNALLVKHVHLEASKPVLAYDFVQGYRLAVGDKLGQ